VTTWTRWIEHPGGDEFSLVCAHGAVSTQQVKAAYSEEAGVAVYHLMLGFHPDLPTYKVVRITIRELLKKLALEQIGCRCAETPYALIVEEQDGAVVGWHFEDAPE
jgi:hypothetical protein